MKIINAFLSLLLLFVGTAFADVAALQCKSSEQKTIFSCGDFSVDAPNGLDNEVFIFAPCVAPTGYAFGGWKVENMGVVFNVATYFNAMMNPPQDPVIVGDVNLVANWIPLIDIDTFSIKEKVVGFLYNPELKKVYYEFASGGIVLNTICSSEDVGDGVANITVDGEVGTLPTASNAVDLSTPGDTCWIGIDAPNGDGMKYISIGTDSDCQNSCAEIPIMLPLYRYVEPGYATVYDAVISQMLSVMLGK